MSHSPTGPVDPQQLAQAWHFWARFTKLTQWGIVSIALLLLGMLIFLV